MTHEIRNKVAGVAILAALVISGTSFASAAEVTGTLNSSASTPGSGGGSSTVGGSIGGGTGTTVTGTVTGGGGGGGGGGNGPIVGTFGNVNNAPQGQVLGASTGPLAQADGTGGGGGEFTPGVPSTGVNGTLLFAYALLASAFLALSGATLLYVRRRM